MVTVEELAKLVNGTFEGDQSATVTGLASLQDAQTSHVSFISQNKFKPLLETTKAGVIFISKQMASLFDGNKIIVDDPYFAYAKCSGLFKTRPAHFANVHPKASVDETAKIGRDVYIGANAVIEKGAQIGDCVIIESGAVIGENVIVDQHCRIAANVVINHDCHIGAYCFIQGGSVIGSDGFGYAPFKGENSGRWQKIEQIGRVIIGQRVEVGANCTIDRGAISDTVIKNDVIIDNLVHIAHNVVIEDGVALAGQVGIAGSTKIGKNSTFGGQCGISGHLDICEGSHFTGQAMVTKSTKEPGVYSSGFPAVANGKWRKMIANLRKLDELSAQVKSLINKN